MCDPLAGKYPSMSPYVYAANNPLKYIDPDGRKVYRPSGKENKRLRRYIRNAYRRSALYRKLHNTALKNDRLMAKFNKLDNNLPQDGVTELINVGEFAVATETTLNARLGPEENFIKKLVHEMTHIDEIGEMTSIEEFNSLYDDTDADGQECTEAAQDNERDTDIDTDPENEKYEKMTDEELDEIIYTPVEEKK